MGEQAVSLAKSVEYTSAGETSCHVHYIPVMSYCLSLITWF